MATIVGTSGNDLLDGTSSSDTIDGLAGNDEMHGEGGADSVVGGAGNDSVGGGAGNDWLEGGLGNDTLGGSGDRDHFVFREFGAANADNVVDLSASWDDIQLDAAAFTQLGAAGRFAPGDARFYSAAGAAGGHDADDRIVFNTTTHQLFYDADGSGSGTAQLIATLTNGANITATDIWAFGAPAPSGAVNGTSGSDTLVGSGGPDTINGLGGNDSLVGNAGADSLNGGDGNDTLDGFNSPRFATTDPDLDTMSGGLGNDLFRVDNAGDVLSDSGGIDTVSTRNVAWTLGAGFENLVIDNGETESLDTFVGNGLANVMDGSQRGWNFVFDGRDGNDTLIGGGRSDTLIGGNGDDRLIVNDPAHSSLTGGAGTDSFVFDRQAGVVDAAISDFQSGIDRIHLDAQAMTALGTTGSFASNDPRFYAAAGATAGHDADDRVVYDSANGHLWYDPDGSGAQNAQLITFVGNVVAADIVVDNGAPLSGGGGGGASEGNDTLIGTPGNDSINGLGGNDSIGGLDGHDTLDGGAGVDTIDGGAGNDTYFVTAGDVLTDAGGIDTVVSNPPYWLLGSAFENLTLGSAASDGDGNALANVMMGNSGANEFHGNGAADAIIGGAGNDSIGGGSGSDWLEGGAGNDTLGGSGDRDHFVFREHGAANADRVVDMNANWDDIRLGSAAFTDLGATGRFASGDARFFSGAGATAAHDASDRIVYDTSTGNLYYDHDGSGGDAAQLVATLQGTPAILATDVWSFS